jgi:hypothetical protein
MYDYEEYTAGRGFYSSAKDLPFTKIYDTKKLVDYMNNFSPSKKVSAGYEEFLKEYCQYDSASNTRNVNDVIFHRRESAKVIDFSQQNDIPLNVKFVGQLTDEKLRCSVADFFNSLKQNDLLVFHQKTFTPETEKIVREYQSKIPAMVIAPSGITSTIFDYLQTLALQKLGWKNYFVRKSYNRKLRRILPNINIASVKNYSSVKFFKDIAKLYRGK